MTPSKKPAEQADRFEAEQRRERFNAALRGAFIAPPDPPQKVTSAKLKAQPKK